MNALKTDDKIKFLQRLRSQEPNRPIPANMRTLIPNFFQRDGRTVYPSAQNHNAAIIFDWNDSADEKIGEDQCNQIILSSGILGPLLKEKDDSGNKVFHNPDPLWDAASIRISQLHSEDPEKNGTGFVKTQKLQSGNASNVSVLADSVDIAARSRGINLRTAGFQYDSTGKKIDPSEGIKLIHGNNIKEKNYDLQPIPKGENLVLCLKDMMKLIGDISSSVTKMHNEIIKMKLDLVSHTHTVPVGPIIYPTTPSIDLAAKFISKVDKDLTTILNNLSNIANDEKIVPNYLEKFSGKYILSRWHKVN